MKTLPTIYHVARYIINTSVPQSRTIVELKELALLSRRACPARLSRGREIEELPCTFRTAFARDRDRIIHSYYFTLLQGKAQVFSPESLSALERQEVHNRVYHVMKVAQIARSICRALGLNEDLAEAIALGHDLGHSPFGHEGEKVLDKLSRKYIGVPFKHNIQSLRVVEEIEKLNLTFEVRDGIVNHDGETKDPILRPGRPGFPATLEGCVVRLADRLAYLPLDLADGLKLGIVNKKQIPKVVRETLGITPAQMIDTLVRDVIRASKGNNYITMSPRVQKALDALYDFNYKYIYFSDLKNEFTDTVEKCINTLYKHFTQTKGLSPRQAIDAIVGMTDLQAIHLYHSISAPSHIQNHFTF